MNEATLTALKQSIEKWEKRAAGEHDGKLGVANCPYANYSIRTVVGGALYLRKQGYQCVKEHHTIRTYMQEQTRMPRRSLTF